MRRHFVGAAAFASHQIVHAFQQTGVGEVFEWADVPNENWRELTRCRAS